MKKYSWGGGGLFVDWTGRLSWVNVLIEILMKNNFVEGD